MTPVIGMGDHDGGGPNKYVYFKILGDITPLGPDTILDKVIQMVIQLVVQFN